MELQNANPTIVTDLPTRRRDNASRNRTQKSRLSAQHAAGLTPFDADMLQGGPFGRSDAQGLVTSSKESWSQQQQGDVDADDAADGGDPIDEQEIFGTLPAGLLSYSCTFVMRRPCFSSADVCPDSITLQATMANASQT